MKFSALILPLKVQSCQGNCDFDISSLAYDSRRVTQGAAFVAIRGNKTDGHQFIKQALENGASAIVAEDLSSVSEGVPAIQVPDSRLALAQLASLYYGNPSSHLKLIGVTGTNGKTTTTHLIEAIFRASGQKTGIMGTLYTRIGDEVIPSERTTPESLDFQYLLAKMVEAKVQCVAMEVSSHALALRRTDCACFNAAAFTNLTQDHLDFHKNFENYLAAKMRLFSDYPSCCEKEFSAVINLDDPYGERVAAGSLGHILGYAIDHEAEIRASNCHVTPEGVAFTVKTPKGSIDISLKLGGRFNIYNALAAIGIAVSQGIDLETIRRGLESVSSVPGRFEAINENQPFSVLVDYAHTPDGLENVISAAAKLTKGRKIVVFGCGGDRDRTKRPIMGRIAATLSDIAVLTSDNPRTEDPNAIIQEVLTGIDPSLRDKVVIDADRGSAIEKAITMAKPGDVVLIAGKGHEPYQIFADKTIHFDDRETARAILHQMGFSGE